MLLLTNDDFAFDDLLPQCQIVPSFSRRNIFLKAKLAEVFLHGGLRTTQILGHLGGGQPLFNEFSVENKNWPFFEQARQMYRIKISAQVIKTVLDLK